MVNILIAASGTGGHIFPALATIKGISKDWKCYWLGVSNRLENEIIPKHYPLYKIQVEGLQGYRLTKLWKLLKLLSGSITVYQLLSNKHIDIVFTTGGYIAAPAILAAYWYGIPIVLHESNAIPGKVTRLLGWLCTNVVVSLPEATQFPYLKANTVETPIRQSFLKLQPIPRWVAISKEPILLIVGGSQGALGLNNMIRVLFPRLLKAGCRIIHLTGKNDPNIGQIQHPLLIERPFINEMSTLLQNVDLVVTRAGAGSLSEISISCTPTVLIPFPQSTDKHQDGNASSFVNIGGTIIVWQDEQINQNLIFTLWRLLGPKLRNTESAINPLDIMSINVKYLGINKSENQLISLLYSLC